MSDVEARLQSALAAVRSYLEAKLVAEAVLASERAMEIAHELGRPHPRYVEAARIAALAYALDNNAGMSARYQRLAITSAEQLPSFPKDKLGSLHFDLARAELDRGRQEEATAALEAAIPLLCQSRADRDAEARQAMFLRVALCMVSGDPKEEMDALVGRLRTWLEPVFEDPEATADTKALAEHDMVTALCSSARLEIAKRRWDRAEAALLEAFERAERHMLTADRPNPHLLGLVSEVYKEMRRASKEESSALRARAESLLGPAAERAERLFWAQLRVVATDAQKTLGWSDAYIAQLLEPALHDAELAADLGRHPLLHGLTEVLSRHAAKGTHLRDQGPNELRRVMRGDKALGAAIDVMEAAGLSDV
ncbi:hypothetical protein [Polyangium spumosum]|uniref:Tetratricopeptide repeat protein n=1 Tax=Polyangium spumosum TaxID=889282 RepID=A0A6N7PV09_9BACT|nr:hypothetical protein [Polyangium spumosum]MRG94270.1 hypothetical protein [Polyangium spumosum]